MVLSEYPTEAPGTVTTVQIGYTIADVLAKAGYGVLIYNVARAKSLEEGFDLDDYTTPTGAQA